MPIATASIRDTIGFAVGVAGPTFAKGILIRRPNVVALAQMLSLDARAVRRMQRLRRDYGAGPLLLRGPGRPRALLLDPRDVRRVLDESPEPFAPATSEKRAALAHFEPDVALATRGPKRIERRRFNERVLQVDAPVHGMAGAFQEAVAEEMEIALRQAADTGTLDWDVFFKHWYRLVRRIVLGRGARDDHELTDMLATLRGRGNWAFFLSKDEALRERFHAHLAAYLERGEQGSLAAMIAATPRTPDTAPSHQVAQWLFAFDPGGMATFRALALLATHPQSEDHAREEMATDGTNRSLPFLRACLQESLRLWPTTPAILRETTRETQWESGRLAPGTTVLIFAPFFHRDDERLDFANRFAPDIWLGDGPAADLALVPFSAGPGVCPARHFVPLVASMALARLLQDRSLTYAGPQELRADRAMPALLDNYRLRFGVRAGA